MQKEEIIKITKVTDKGFAIHDGPFVKALDEALQSFRVHRQQNFGGVFVGNHIHKTLQVHTRVKIILFNSLIIMFIFSQNTLSVCVPPWLRWQEQGVLHL